MRKQSIQGSWDCHVQQRVGHEGAKRLTPVRDLPDTGRPRLVPAACWLLVCLVCRCCALQARSLQAAIHPTWQPRPASC